MQKAKQKLRRFRETLAKKKRLYIKARPHRSFRKTANQHRLAPTVAPIKTIAIESFGIIWREKRLLAGLAALYITATYLVVGGIAQADFVGLRDATLEVFGGSFNSLGTAFNLFTSTMTGAFNGDLTQLQQAIGLLIAVLFWLALVWALRMRFANQPIKIRDALYNSAAPLIAYAVVGLIIILQLTPGALGIIVFATAQNGGWLQGGVEVMAFVFAALLLMTLSLYWLAGSLLSLVIVTLPQMYPWRAIQMAGELVIGRRLRIVIHAVALAGILFVLWAAVLLPVILLDGWLRFEWLPLIPFTVQALGAGTLIFAATYVYRLYRSFI